MSSADMNFLASLGSLTLGSRLKKLSDILFNEVNIIYEKTGLKIQVPIFIKEGEVIKVDTRTGEYLGRK